MKIRSNFTIEWPLYFQYLTFIGFGNFASGQTGFWGDSGSFCNNHVFYPMYLVANVQMVKLLQQIWSLLIVRLNSKNPEIGAYCKSNWTNRPLYIDACVLSKACTVLNELVFWMVTCMHFSFPTLSDSLYFACLSFSLARAFCSRQKFMHMMENPKVF